MCESDAHHVKETTMDLVFNLLINYYGWMITNVRNLPLFLVYVCIFAWNNSCNIKQTNLFNALSAISLPMVWLSIELNSNPNLSNSQQLFNLFQKNYWILFILIFFAKSNSNLVYDFNFWHYINSILCFLHLIYYILVQCLCY